ncbi:hypothetical protein PPYR_00645 [Photinus pyralis]|uniref:Uncharacterized protein n=1 Tax=Photinus pyralis TaxID=7054 RepID=A0A5N4B260_PHOPY|nr:hypothetical protein PPYR_00645 [Photinus pyralis]
MMGDATIWSIFIIFKILLVILFLFWIRNRQKRRLLARQQCVITSNIVTYPQPVLSNPYIYQTQFGQSATHPVYTNASSGDLPPSYAEVAKQAKV